MHFQAKSRQRASADTGAAVIDVRLLEASQYQLRGVAEEILRVVILHKLHEWKRK